MTMEPEQSTQFDAMYVDYLRLIQSVIQRMALNSLIMKSLGILTPLVVLLNTSSDRSNSAIYFVLFVIFIFFLLDAMYLNLERRYRGLYEVVRSSNWSEKPSFSLKLPKEVRKTEPLALAALSWAVFPIYAALVVVLLAVSGIM